jgi:hypothetical protein
LRKISGRGLRELAPVEKKISPLKRMAKERG